MTTRDQRDARRSGDQLLIAGCVMALAGALLLLLDDHGEVPSDISAPTWVVIIAGLYTLTHLASFHVEVRGQALSVSLSDLPLVVGLFFVPAEALVGARLLSAAALFVVSKPEWRKAAFNVGLWVLEVAVAVTILHALAETLAPGLSTWLATFASVLVVDLLGAVAVIAAMRVLGSRPTATSARLMLVAVVVSGALSTALGLMAVVVLDTSMSGFVLFAVVTAVVAVAHRGYHRLVRQHNDLNRLFASTQQLGAAQDADAVVDQLLSQARELLSAESAELRQYPRTGVTAHPDGFVLDGAEPRLLPRTSRDPAVRRWLARANLRDAVLVPVRDKGEVVAVLQVGNREGAASTFTDDDLRLLQTLVAHAEVQWQNGQLLEKLRYDAMHDNLTGLSNRALFNRELEALLEDSRNGAVLLLDLDRFKEVNDALGHPVGDKLLEKVAERLRSHVPANATVARLGGDEFAILLDVCRSADEALATARAARAALTGPFEVDETFLEVGASVGVAMVPGDGDDAATVLRRADLAMYEAKRSSAGVTRYVPSLDHRSTDRLELAGELRAALESEQIAMHFQPKASLRTGRVVGFEALARWHHPERGTVMPDVFIPLAEQTGLVGQLTHAAIVQSLRRCREWLRISAGVGVAVNLSPRRLLEPGLATVVRELLNDANVPADLLTLEITESSVMADPDAAVRALHQLRDLGVRLSVDDFGTGYSSLNYLQRLPIHEVKIDKSFILPMAREKSATAIVEYIVQLSHNLGLTVVAEGVEDEATQQVLADVGCDVQQGYALSRPIPPQDVGRWLVAHRESVRQDRRGRPRAI